MINNEPDILEIPSSGKNKADDPVKAHPGQTVKDSI